jgi:hypothetical protein
MELDIVSAVSLIGTPISFGIGVVAMGRLSEGELWFAIVALISITHGLPMGPSKLIITGVIGAAIAICLVLSLDWVQQKQKAFESAPGGQTSNAPSQSSHPEAQPQQGAGGTGGGAKVGGNGIAIGGPGGPSGKYGTGGAGGAGEVAGDGIATGGAGGASGDDGVWRAPAKSGYEIYQRKMGLPVDPNMRAYGRGGAMPGYEPKLQVVEGLRTSYFRNRSKKPESIFENINAVPLEYTNTELAKRKEIWRARIVDDEYEFFIPH